MFLDPVTPSNIIDITSKLKAKTSQGHDGISSKLLKESIQYIAIDSTNYACNKPVTINRYSTDKYENRNYKR